MRSLGSVLVILALAALQSCSTVRTSPSGRRGLLDGPQSGARAGALSESHASSEDRAERREEAATAVASSKAAEQIKTAGLRWPLAEVRVTSPFGKRAGSFHEGIDLRAQVGTSIYAAQAGRVLYAGAKIRGYGKMIVIRHRGGIATVYAHASKLLVHQGQQVHVGQKIAVSGKSGRVTGPHLHFELRSGAVAVDPQQFLVAYRRPASEVVVAKHVRAPRKRKLKRYARHLHRRLKKHRTIVAARETAR